MEGFRQTERGFIQRKAMGRYVSVAGRIQLRGGLLVSWIVGLLPLAGVWRSHPPGGAWRAPSLRATFVDKGPRSVVAAIAAHLLRCAGRDGARPSRMP